MLAEQFWHGLFEVPQIAIVMGCLVPIAGVIAYYWYMAQKVRSENELKRTLVDRGLSAAEIERILTAHGKDPRE
ncbi:MAG: hypothetical protein ABII12_06140 [Planctomycetota bacterium]|nr:hypothetical protein [bacterium]